MKRLIASVMILVSLMLTGCGFYMRGTGDMNEKLLPEKLKTIHVVGDDRSDIYRMVTSQLRHSGVKLTENSDNAVELNLGNISVSNTEASRNNRSQVVEYLMIFNTDYTIALPNQSPQKFSARFSRVFLNKSAQALASSREQDQLRKEMEKQTADLIIIQLSRVIF